MKKFFILLAVAMMFSIGNANAEKSPKCKVHKTTVEWTLLKGKCKNGLAHGKGKAKSSKGDIYEGQFRSGRFHGQGTYTYPNGQKYVGELKDGKSHGQGTYTWPGGHKYVGELKDGMRHGQGTHTWPNGTKYVGGWKDGKSHGQGTYTWAGEWKGQIYDGQWKDDKKHGQGTFTWTSGVTFEGTWSEGKQGKGAWSFKHPKIKKPHALYVHAGKLERNKEILDAKVVYEHLINNFPNSQQAEKASDRLTAISDKAEEEARARREASAREASMARLLEAQTEAQISQMRHCAAGCESDFNGCDKSRDTFRWGPCNDDRRDCYKTCGY